jgi:hypothetical protein
MKSQIVNNTFGFDDVEERESKIRAITVRTGVRTPTIYKGENNGFIAFKNQNASITGLNNTRYINQR